MAEVTGDLGGQPIQLNNAATEATLKQLLAAMLASVAQQGKNTKKDAKIQQELEAELRKLAKQAKDFKKAQDDAAAALKANTKKTEENTEAQKKKAKADSDAKKAQEEFKKSLEDNIAKLGALSSALEGGIGQINKVTSTFTNLGSSVTAAASSLSAIPVVGNMLAGVFGTVAGAAEKSYKAFQQSASVGANFGGSINDLIRASSEAGMTFDQFSGVIAKNGEALALLGGSTRDGARRLADLGKEIKRSPLMGELAGLGYTTEEVNSGMAKYTGMLAKTGNLQGKTNAELVAGSADYLKNLDQLSRLTGKSKDALQAEQDALMADAQFKARLQDMDEKGQQRLMKLMQSLPPSLQKGAKEFIAFGGATTDAGREFGTFLQKGAGAANAAFREINQSGTLSQKGADAVYDAIKTDADAIRKSGTGKLLANVGNGAQQALYADAVTLASRKKTSAEIQTEQEKELEAQKARTKKAQEDLNPESMMKFQQLIAETNNRFTEMVGNHLPQLQSMFTKLAGFVESYVLPAFSLIAKHIEIVVAGMLALKVAQLAYKAALVIEKMKEAKKPSGRPGDPLHVTDDGGGPDIPGRGKKGGRGGKRGKMGGLGGAKTLVRGTAAVGAVIAVAELADNIGDINDRIKEGELTEREGTVEKGGAIGGAAGTAGGAWAGAAAGAAIGSVVPVVGTVIGGLIGGAIGGWLGKKGGEAIGKSVTSAVTEISMDDLKKDQKLYKQYLDRYNEALARNLKLGKSKEDADKLAIAEANKALNIKKEEIRVTKEKIEADAKAAEKAKEAAATPPPELDFDDPQRLYDSFKKRQGVITGQPQVAPPSGTAAPIPVVPSTGVPSGGLGAVAEKYESNGRGSETVGWDKVGGTSYGKKQISSRAGAMTDYLKFLEKTGKGDVAKQLRDAGIEKDTGSTSGKAVDVWKKLAASGALGNSENEFLGQGYGTALKGLKDQDLKTRIENSRALQEMLFSTAVQHGPGGAMGIFNSVFKPGMSDEALVKAVYAERGADGGKKHFSGSTANVQAGVVNRFGREQGDILALLGTPGTASSTALAQAPNAQRPTTPTTSTPQTPTTVASTVQGQPVPVASSSVSGDFGIQVALAGQTFQASVLKSAQILEKILNDKATQQTLAQNGTTGTTKTGTTGMGAPGAGGVATLNEVVAGLEMLNKQLGQLVSISRTTADLNESQLRVQKNMGGDMFLTA